MSGIRSPAGASRLLPVLAWGQAALILLLAFLLLRTGDPAPPPAVGSAAASPLRESPSATRGALVPTGAEPAAAPAARPAAVAPPADPPGTVLYGLVRGGDGSTIPSGVIWLHRAADLRHVANISLRPDRPDYAIAAMPAGQYAYRTRATGHQEQHGMLTIPAGVTHLRHDFVLERTWELLVKILTPDGRPIQGALQELVKTRRAVHVVEVGAVVTAARPEGDLRPTPLREVDGGLGRWRANDGLSARDARMEDRTVAGMLEIDQRQPVWVSAVLRHRVLASAPVTPQATEVVLTVSLEQVLGDLGQIRGRIVDGSTGEPVTDASVDFGDLQSWRAGWKVDEHGRFEIRDLRPGLLDVQVRAGDLSAQRDLVLLAPGQTLELGDLPVFQRRTIQGRCTNLQGKAEDCRISCLSLDPPTHAMLRRHRHSANVAADGTFSLSLPEGSYLLRAHGAGGAVLDLDTRTLGDAPLVLALAPEASLRLHVQTAGESWELAVFDGRGRELHQLRLQHGWRFPLPFLPGDLRVELTDGRGRRQTRQLRLGPEGADLRVP